MKKFTAVLLSAVLAFACLAVLSSAGFETDVAGTVFEVRTTPNITFSYHATETTESVKPGSAVTLVPRGGCTIEALADGDLVMNATGFSDKGIITVENSTIPLLAQRDGVAAQADEDIPTFSFTMDFGEKVTFDTAYMALYHQIGACIAIPGEKKVIVEVSEDGTTFVPVDSGIYYFNSNAVGDYVKTDDQGVDECPVYLGEEVTARYVRFTYTFMKVMEGGHWQYYTNVHDWTGFTEIGVASYKSGKKPIVLSENDVADPTEVLGSWIGDDGENVYIYDFLDETGKKTVNIMTFDSAEYQEKGLDAELKSHEIGLKYAVTGHTLTITYSRKRSEDIPAELDEDGNLILGKGKKAVAYSAYTDPEVELVRGEWMYELEEDGKKLLVLATIDTAHIEEKYYDYDAWQEKGFEAEAHELSNYKILRRGSIVTILSKEPVDVRVALDEDGTLHLGDKTMLVKADPKAEDPGTASSEPAENSVLPEPPASTDENPEPVSDEPAPVESEAEPLESQAAPESAPEESKPAEQSGGFPWWGWVLIGAGVLAVAGVIIGVVSNSKKKK